MNTRRQFLIRPPAGPAVDRGKQLIRGQLHIVVGYVENPAGPARATNIALVGAGFEHCRAQPQFGASHRRRIVRRSRPRSTAGRNALARSSHPLIPTAKLRRRLSDAARDHSASRAAITALSTRMPSARRRSRSRTARCDGMDFLDPRPPAGSPGSPSPAARFAPRRGSRAEARRNRQQRNRNP